MGPSKSGKTTFISSLIHSTRVILDPFGYAYLPEIDLLIPGKFSRSVLVGVDTDGMNKGAIVKMIDYYADKKVSILFDSWFMSRSFSALRDIFLSARISGYDCYLIYFDKLFDADNHIKGDSPSVRRAFDKLKVDEELDFVHTFLLSFKNFDQFEKKRKAYLV